MTTARTTEIATIANAGTTSPTVTVPTNSTLLGFVTPPGMTGTGISFKAGVAASDTPVVLKPNNTTYSITIDATAGYYPVDPNHFEGISYLQVVSNLAEVGAKDITLVFGRT